jgi:hypothetical protein
MTEKLTANEIISRLYSLKFLADNLPLCKIGDIGIYGKRLSDEIIVTELNNFRFSRNIGLTVYAYILPKDEYTKALAQTNISKESSFHLIQNNPAEALIFIQEQSVLEEELGLFRKELEILSKLNWLENSKVKRIYE